jgi:quercetin dioxygenase-like cupin family protein
LRTEGGSREKGNLPGKRLVTPIVDYPPEGGSASHRHARSAFIYAYVISGQIRSQVESEPARVYRADEAWFESPGSRQSGERQCQ